MKNNDNIELYFHIPFCLKKCFYCDFYSIEDQSLVDDYINSLISNIKSFEYFLSNKKITSIYFGGGTPSLISQNYYFKIFDYLHKSFCFSENCEITIEANPNSIDYIKVSDYYKTGFNRISLGLQTSNSIQLKAIGRVHSLTDFDNAYNASVNAGFKNISIDLLYGIPNQTENDLYNSINYSISYNPQHISLYGLKIERNTPFGNSKYLKLPDDSVQSDMYLNSCNLLKSNNYLRYEISNFSLGGNFNSTHNIGYWTGADYLGIGPSASSKINNIRFQYSRNITDYIESFLHNKTVHYSEYRLLSDSEKYNEYVMLGLRLENGIIPDCRLINLSSNYVNNGYMIIRNDRLSFTTKGFLISNYILSDLIL